MRNKHTSFIAWKPYTDSINTSFTIQIYRYTAATRILPKIKNIIARFPRAVTVSLLRMMPAHVHLDSRIANSLQFQVSWLDRYSHVILLITWDFYGLIVSEPFSIWLEVEVSIISRVVERQCHREAGRHDSHNTNSIKMLCYSSHAHTRA